ncbi:MAG: amidohydrolase family protein [Desulfobacterales bacterium]|nr:amidohydrolase family protein [Desulfobacterales bacterium]
MTATLFQNGTIIDGTGKPAFAGSLLVEDDRIKDIITNGNGLPPTDQVIDTDGLVIAPGFIDMHSHADWVLPWQDHPKVLKCLVEQGITTVVGGNCGISPAPMTAAAVTRTEILATMVKAGPFEYRWESMDEYLGHIEKSGTIVNLAELVGHAPMRYIYSSVERGDLPAAELEACLAGTRRALDEGACGFSFGLGYDPGMYSSMEELAAFCKVAAQADKPVTIHMKALSKLSPCYPLTSLSAHNVRALKEAIAIAEQTGVRMQLSHFIFVGRNSWSTADECLRLVAEARSRGLDIMIDAFPFTSGNTTILAPVPFWFLEKIPEAYHNPFLRARLRLELALGFKLVGFGYKDFQVMDIAIDGYEDFNGLYIPEIARQWNCSPFQAMLRLAEESNGSTLMLFHTYSGEPGNESALEKVLSQDHCLFETDVLVKAAGFPNPAGAGTFPRILGTYVREKNLFSLENAIHRMTGASAERFGIKDTGTLEKGKAADVVCFDPDTVGYNYDDPARPPAGPEGIAHVFLNGEQVVKKGAYVSDIKAGRVIRH